MPLPSPHQKPIRLTIAVSPEVHAAFERLSAASGVSMSKAMGEWLADTLDAVQYTATMVEKARQAPKLVMQEMHAYALGLADETGSVLAQVREKARQAPPARAESGASAARRGIAPPSSNTGGKTPSTPTRKAKK